MSRSVLRLLLGLSLLLALGHEAAPRLAAQPIPLPDQGAEAPHFDLAELERLVLREINRVRREHERSPLLPDLGLTFLARRHSQAMLERGFFAHRDPEGRQAGDRARRAGYAFHHLGENLFRGRLYDTLNVTRRGDRVTESYLWHTPQELAALAVEMWMESPGHRENMLSGVYDFGGVGIAVGREFEVLMTLNLSAL